VGWSGLKSGLARVVSGIIGIFLCRWRCTDPGEARGLEVPQALNSSPSAPGCLVWWLWAHTAKVNGVITCAANRRIQPAWTRNEPENHLAYLA